MIRRLGRRLIDRAARRLGYVPRELVRVRWQRIEFPLSIAAPLPVDARLRFSTWVAVPPLTDRDEFWLDGLMLERESSHPPYAVTNGDEVVYAGVRA